jgi:uncharacterized protein
VLRRIGRFALIALAVYLVGCLASAIFLAEITVHLQHKPIRHRAEFASVVQQQFHSGLSDVAITADDGAILKAWYANPQTSNGSSLILLHGITDNREGVAGYARMFLNHGYAVLLPDSRAHGESGGGIATYGVKERYDVRRWTEWLQQRSSGCVYLFGESMGAAISLQATAVTPQLCAVAVESPYSTFREIAYDRISRHSRLPVWFARTAARPVLEFALIYTRVRYGVDLTQADPQAALAQSSVPALLIAGTADRNIPLRHSLSIMRVANSHAELWQVPGANHGGAVNVSPSQFDGRVITWFQTHPNPS